MAFDKPQSRNEAILQNMLGANNELEPPQSRVEALLQDIAGQMPEANPSEGTTTGTLDRLKIGDEIYSVEGGGGIRPIGVTTTPLYDGATTNPIQINGESYTAETGDMVTYQSTEFLFNVNEVWQELGDVSVVLAIIDDIFADIAPAFDATSTYAVGDYVIYNDQLYKCTTAHTGTWAAADFTATSLSDEIKNNKGTVYTAGKYINIDANNEISVDPVVPNEAFTYRIYGNNGHHTVEKIVDGVVVHRENHESGEFDPPIIYDDAIKITYYNAGSMKYECLIPSDTHEVGYVQTWTWWNNIDFTETFSTVDHTGEKLVIKSELDAALADKQDALTAGRYINIDANNEIKVNPVIPNESFTYRITYVENFVFKVTKMVDGAVVFEQNYTSDDASTPIVFDDAIKFWSEYWNWYYELLVDSDSHSAGFKQKWGFGDRIDYTEIFSTIDHTGEKLITKSDMDAALAYKQDNLMAGDYIKFEDEEISVKRLVLDGDEYTYEIYTKSTQTHVVVDKYDSNSTLVSTREYYMNDLSPAVEVDGLFTLYAYGGPWTCTLLVDSKDHEAGYSFSCQWNVYTHYPETFELPPEESPNDLIIRSELDAALADVSDDINSLESGLTSLLNAFSSLGLSVVNGKVCQTYKTN